MAIYNNIELGDFRLGPCQLWIDMGIIVYANKLNIANIKYVLCCIKNISM